MGMCAGSAVFAGCLIPDNPMELFNFIKINHRISELTENISDYMKY